MISETTQSSQKATTAAAKISILLAEEGKHFIESSMGICKQESGDSSNGGRALFFFSSQGFLELDSMAQRRDISKE
jgi:hypothetical protein